MYLFYVLSLFLVISGYVMTNTTSEEDDAILFDGRVAAAQMYVYHKAAVAYCKANPGYCATARILPVANVKSMLPDVAQRAPSSNNVYDAGDYLSATTGSGAVATHYRIKNAISTQAGFTESSRAMVQELRRLAPTYWPAARYDRGNQRVVAVSGKTITVPQTISGYTFEHQVPMLATEY